LTPPPPFIGEAPPYLKIFLEKIPHFFKLFDLSLIKCWLLQINPGRVSQRTKWLKEDAGRDQDGQGGRVSG
jgi:hypothetical protein